MRAAAHAELTLGAPLSADPLFQPGSVCKVLTAIVLARLAEEGRVRLDDPIERFMDLAGAHYARTSHSDSARGLPSIPVDFRAPELPSPEG